MEDRRLHLAAIVESANHVCCRYRVAAFRAHLEAAGHRLDLIPYPSSLWHRFRLPATLADYDAVLLQRRLLPTWMLKRLRARVRRLLFDFDDAVYLRDSFHPRGLHDPRRLRAFAATMHAADLVIAGNAFLADAARRQGAAAVRVIPTCVDATRYPTARHQWREDVRLVWIGSSSTLQGLRQITPLLEHVGRRNPNVRLKLVCDQFLRLQYLPVDEVSWSEVGEASELASADIGIAWMPNDDWSRGKCGLKVLQYMAAGLPVIANPVGVHAEMVEHGQTGLLAATADEWVEAVARLASAPEMRRRMGEAGRRRVEQRYGVAVGAAMFVATTGQVVGFTYTTGPVVATERPCLSSS
jgi:glycosyltransferase involved in cell wall biosynthesis